MISFRPTHVSLLLAGVLAATPWTPANAAPADVPGLIFADDFELGFLVRWGLVAPEEELPVDPAETAPDYDPTLALDPYDANEFLWTDPDPVQRGVAAGAIDPNRICLVRGRVLNRLGQPLPGVEVFVQGEPGLGRTLTRADGVFDLAVNGGGTVDFRFRARGLLPVARSLEAPRRDWLDLEDVVMIGLDPEVTEITAGATEVQVARGSVESDADGNRQATLMFPANLVVERVEADGSRVPLTSLHVRATEYTVGATGPQAMPAPLPIHSGYTYAVELSADEVLPDGGSHLEFSEPVAVYLENFLDLPAGEPVPAGFFDRERGEWIPAPNGRVVAILSVTAGLAELDVDGSGLPADSGALAALGITDDERLRLAMLYPVGQSLWRVGVTHFTPWDFNWPAGPPPDAIPPPDPEDAPPPPDEPPPPEPDPDPEDGQPEEPEPDCMSGSIIECENQTLRESVALVGVPYRLHYASDRVKGRASRSYFKVRLTDSSIPSSLERVQLEVSAAGGKYGVGFDPVPNLIHEVSWTALDRFDRPLHAETPVTIRITYLYRLRYYSVKSDWESAFSRLPGGDSVSVLFSSIRSSEYFRISRTHSTTAGNLAGSVTGAWDVTGERLGGWTFDVHHRYSPSTRTLLLGTGERRYAQDVGTVAARIAGTGESGDSGDGGPARLAQLDTPLRLALGADESLYIVDSGAHRVRRVGPDGTITTVAGSGTYCEFDGCGDGGLATEASFFGPSAVAVRPDGRLLIADWNCIREVGLDGVIETVAGFCDAGGGGSRWQRGAAPATPADLGCDECPALAAELTVIQGLALAPGGGYFFADAGSNRIRFVGADGIVTTLAGSGDYSFSGDGGPARLASLRGPEGVAVGPNGEVLIADTFNHRIRRVGRDGRIETVAGSGLGGFAGDGGPAASAKLFLPGQLAVSPDGSYLIADELNGRTRRVSPGGTIDSVAGSGEAGSSPPAGGFALQVPIEGPRGVAVDRSGLFYVADSYGAAVYWVGDDRGTRHDGEIWIPSAEGSQVYEFDSRGRHLRTRRTLTGAVLLQFGYSSAGHLTSITDADGNVTTVVRDPGGNPTAVVGPYGQSTAVTLDAFGHLESLTDPAGQSWQFVHSSTGLLTSVVDPNENPKSFVHNAFGRLASETDAGGGTQTLVRETFRDHRFSWNLVRTWNQEGRFVSHETWDWGRGTRRWRSLGTGFGSSLVTVRDRLFDGSEVVRRPDGSVTVVQKRTDPLWGSQAAAIGSSSFSTPGGIVGATSSSTDFELADPLDPSSLVSRTEQVTVNGRTTTATYDAALRRWTMTSPEGRQRSVTLDAVGKPTFFQWGGLAPVSLEYDTHGRLASIRRGSGLDERIVDFTYDTLGRLETLTDPLLRTVSFTYDDANRVETQTLPGSRVIGFDRDAKGNLLGLTPPGRPTHGFSYTSVDRTESYDPPSVGPGTWSTTYAYDLDRKVSQITRPDGATIRLGYDVARRLETITSPRGTTTIAYDPDTGHVSSITTPEGNGLHYEMDGPLVTQVTWTGEVEGSVERTYDANLRVTSISVNGANPVAYSYDDDGLLVQAGDLVLTRDPTTGLLTDTVLGVVTTHYDYDTFGELEAMSASVSGTPIFTTSYVRDKLGRITTKTEMIEGVTKVYVYGYDPAGRLDTVTIDGVLSADYDYDANGNRLQKWTPGGTEAGTYDDQDRLLTYAGASYGHTRNGELQTKTDGDGTTTYDYDVFGNLLGVDLPDGTEIDYTVDARNRRIGRKEDGAWTQKLLWQSQLAPVAELDAANAIVSRFVNATRLNVPDYMLRGGSTYRVLTDHLGSPRLVVEAASGLVLQRLDWSEWGSKEVDTLPGVQPFGFGGAIADSETQVLRSGSRDYAADSARWLARDPLLFQRERMSLYSYAFNDPVNAIDPSGLSGCDALVRFLGSFFDTPELLAPGLGAGLMLGAKDARGRADQLPSDGFREGLVAYGQEGQVWAHVMGHAGAQLLGDAGAVISGLEIQKDIEQAGNRQRPMESLSELLGDLAGLEVGRILDQVLSGDIPSDQALDRIHDLLCDDKECDL